MKKLLVFTILINLFLELKPQNVCAQTDSLQNANEDVFQIVEDPAKPVGDYTAFYGYVKKSLTYPSQAKRMGVEGIVYVQFVVETDGSLTEVKVMKSIGAGCDEEAARVIKEAPKWQSAKFRGKPVRQRVMMPITFKKPTE